MTNTQKAYLARKVATQTNIPSKAINFQKSRPTNSFLATQGWQTVCFRYKGEKYQVIWSWKGQNSTRKTSQALIYAIDKVA